MAGQRWTRKEDLAVLYLKIKFRNELKSPQNHPVVCAFAESIERTVASVTMRIANFNSLDTSMPGTGLTKAANLTKEIWREYKDDPKQAVVGSSKMF